MSSVLCNYINSLSNHIVSIAKHSAADISFFIAHNAETSADELNSDQKANLD